MFLSFLVPLVTSKLVNQKLREEIAILNGDELDPIENESDETKRSMKLMLRNGIIPDASVIFAARKKREMARQEDFIPVGKSATTKFKSGNKSRIVRLVVIGR